jgi:hypothetical protein
MYFRLPYSTGQIQRYKKAIQCHTDITSATLTRKAAAYANFASAYLAGKIPTLCQKHNDRTIFCQEIETLFAKGPGAS